MNKKFLSLGLIFLATVSVSVFGSDKKVEAPKKELPRYVEESFLFLEENVNEAEKKIKGFEEQITEAQKNNKKPEQKTVENLVDAKERLDYYKHYKKALDTYVDMKYDQTLLNKIATPARKLALWVANNGKVALALEATGLTGLAYVVYKSFFTPEEDEEDSL